ncbi:DUF1492 domain-containing protein [uncultured Ruminococcus sp.]|uniref:DUF1492 domain-containing protein n=1 Tax=uncultured Ruminococcus sp. TaxID=165186 RepID=UPI0025D58F84|nr:DUF1492 domain-containing protein [uncultured Ruminococcus sp.]
MTAKEYLSQAYRLDKRIDSKIEQLKSLNLLATKCTSTLSDMPKSQSAGNSRLEDTVVKIVDLQEEINKDIDSLVDLKRDIVRTIKSVQNPEYQIILELRYLCFKTWEEIAVQMNCSIDNVFKIRKNALKSVVIPKS